MYKKIIVVVLSLFVMISFLSCNLKEKKTNNTTSTLKSNGSKIKVVVSFNPLREFTEAIGGNKISINTVIPDGTEPHDFEPKIKDIKGIIDSKIFIYNGLGMEPWVDKTMDTLGDNKNLILVNASTGCNIISSGDGINNDKEVDPHIWLSIKMAEIECKNIKDALVKVDSGNKEYYEKNYNDYCVKLENVFNEYKKKFDTVKNKDFITGHAAFAYLCRDFGLRQDSVEDVFAEGEPTPRKMEQLIDYCRKNNVKTVFVEDMVSPKVSETLAKEVNAGVKKVYTLESREDNKDYIQSISDDLEEIYESLEN